VSNQDNPIYRFLKNELTTLWEYIKENHTKDFIWHWKSLVGAPIMFFRENIAYSKYALITIVSTRLLSKINFCYHLIIGILDQLGQAKIYTKIDLREAYNLMYIKKPDE